MGVSIVFGVILLASIGILVGLEHVIDFVIICIQFFIGAFIMYFVIKGAFMLYKIIEATYMAL